MKRLTLGFRFVTMFKPDNDITIRCFIDTHYIHKSVNINIIGPTVNAYNGKVMIVRLL